MYKTFPSYCSQFTGDGIIRHFPLVELAICIGILDSQVFFLFSLPSTIDIFHAYQMHKEDSTIGLLDMSI
jgi:hypothetical protein